MHHLSEISKRLSTSTYADVKGVLRVDAVQPGPIVGVTIATHGSEPCGLAVAEKILNGEIAPTRGSLILVLNNPRALENYLQSRSEAEKVAARFIDVNLNRLPSDVFHSTDDSYEIQRAKELEHLWGSFDYGLDIHSTTQDSEPMIVAIGALRPELIAGFPIQKIVSNVEAVQVGKPASSFYGKDKENTAAFAIECGAHEQESSFQRAIVCVEAFLANTGDTTPEEEESSIVREEYEISESVIFPDNSYELTDLFKNYQFVKKGTVLARGNGPDIIARQDSHTLFAASRKETKKGDEMLFLTKPVREIRSS